LGFDPSIGFLVPGIGDWTREDLDPEFFVAIGIQFGEGTSNAS
jgi:hypothetical protein